MFQDKRDAKKFIVRAAAILRIAIRTASEKRGRESGRRRIVAVEGQRDGRPPPKPRRLGEVGAVSLFSVSDQPVKCPPGIQRYLRLNIGLRLRLRASKY